MRNVLRWASGCIVRRYQTVGPRHDPYGRENFSLFLKGREEPIVLRICGLAGFMLTLPNGRSYAIDCVNDHEQTKSAWENLNAICEAETGHTFKFWTEKIWELYEKYSWRNDPEGRATQQMAEDSIRRYI